MHIIRLVPKESWELPITCPACGTQIALEWDDIHIRESIEPSPQIIRLTVFRTLVFPDCPGCSRRLEPSEEQRRLIDRHVYRAYRAGQPENRARVVVSEPLKKARAAGLVDDFGYGSKEIVEWG